MNKISIVFTIISFVMYFNVYKLNAQNETDSPTIYLHSELAETSSEPSENGWGYGMDSLYKDLAIWQMNPMVSVDTFGYSVNNRPMIEINIRDANKKPSSTLSIHARTHAAEVQSTHVTNEMIKILLSDSELSSKLLDSFTINIVPMYNPDGVEMGLARTNANGEDIEGGWQLDNPQPEVAALRKLYDSIMKSEEPIRIALNMHSSIACKRYFVYHHPNGTSVAYAEDEKRFISAIQKYYPDGIQSWNYNITWSTGTPVVYPESWFWFNFHESVMALTYEDMNCELNGNYNITAKALLQGIYDYITTTGTGINSLVSDNIATIFPNPVRSGGILNIKTSRNASDDTKVELLNLQGKAVYIDKLARKTNTHAIKLPAVPTGLYLLNISNNNKNQYFRIIVN